MNEISIDATPDKSLLKKLGLVGYRTEQAIAELVDNSIDARISDRRTNIEIELDRTNNRIAIHDDAKGMRLNELRDAWTIAKSSKASDEKLGRFGIGMKSACSALGDAFAITTTAKGSNESLTLEYDESEWLNDARHDWTNIRVKKDRTDNNTHGTAILITKLHVPLYPAQVTNIISRFGTRYEPYITSDEISIRINKRNCNPNKPEVKKDTRKNIEIHMLDGSVIRGWIGLLKQRSIKGDYGIHLYHRGRIIETYAKFGIPKHPSTANVIGVLHLDNIPVDVFKTKFLSYTDRYQSVLDRFKAEPNVIHTLKMAKSHTRKMEDYQSILNLQENDDFMRITRLGYRDTQELLSNFQTTTISSDSHLIKMDLVDHVSGVYDVEYNNGITHIMVNRNSAAFKAFRNPLFLLMMIRLEVESFPIDSNMSKIVQIRNQEWEKFISKMTGEVKLNHAKSNLVQYKNIAKFASLPYQLEDIRDYISNTSTLNFQFTALSTLAKFLHYKYSNMVYTIYTEKNRGEDLKDMLTEYGSYVILHDPNKSELSTTLNAIRNSDFIIIREYSSIPSATVASLEKSWVDLYFEVTRNGLLMYEQELRMIIDLLAKKMVNQEKIVHYADRRKITQDIVRYIGGSKNEL